MANKSEQKTFTLNCGCDRYTPYTIVWLNKKGGFDAYTFRLKSTRTITNEKKEWSRYLSTLQPGDVFSYKIGDRGRKVYASRSFETVTCVSTWQTAAENNWVAELFESVEVYYYTDGNYIPVISNPKSVEIRDKSGFSNRMLSHTIDFTYANERVNQRG